MLNLAAAACSENRTERLCALWNALDQLEQLGNRIRRLSRRDAHEGALAGKWTEAEDDEPLRSRDRLSIGEEIGEAKVEVRRYYAVRQAS